MFVENKKMEYLILNKIYQYNDNSLSSYVNDQ